jgi:DNA replication and repair protein RecF
LKLDYINITDLRNHPSTKVEFCEGFNLFVGDNGQGKTTLLEAISIVSHSKSFHASQDKQLVRYGSELGYIIYARATMNNSSVYEVKVFYPVIGQKKITDSTGKRVFPKDIIGILPLVTLSPDDRSLTSGSPENRRVYIDRILSQTSRKYLEDILDYRKILRQRNKLLGDYKNEISRDYTPIAIWTDKLIERGADITLKRQELISQMNGAFSSHYSSFASENESVRLKYLPHYVEKIGESPFDSDSITRKFEQNYKRLMEVEKIRGVSLIGPQRDDLEITINGMTAKDSASQGQHKSLLIALKFTELDYIKDSTGTKPMVILDDIFSELDRKRSHNVLGILGDLGGQIFISSTDLSVFDNSTIDRACIFDVSGGNVTKRT